MAVLEAVRPEDTEVHQDPEIPTESEPRLHRLLRSLHIGGASQDNSITVIENPGADGAGYIGYLFATHFTERRMVKHFSNATYFRVNTYNFRVLDQEDYTEVHINPGFSPVLGMYDFLTTVPTNSILPRPTKKPYEIGFFEPELYDKLLSNLRNSNYIEGALREINSNLAQRIRSFQQDPGSGLLILPDTYATLSTSDVTAA